jgi:hypothetical protein
MRNEKLMILRTSLRNKQLWRGNHCVWSFDTQGLKSALAPA